MADNKSGFFKRLFKFGRKDKAKEEATAETERLARESVETQARLKVEAELKVAQQEVQHRAALAAKEEANEQARLVAAELARKEKAQVEERAAAKAAQRLADKEAKTKEADQLAAKKKLETEKAAVLQSAKLAKAEHEKREKQAIEAEVAKKAGARKAEQEKEEKNQARQEAKVEAGRKEAEEKALIQAENEAAEAARIEAKRLQKQKEAEFEAAETAQEQEAGSKKTWLLRLRDGLSRSSNQLSENITSVFTKRKLDDDTLQNLEDILIQADLGVETATSITEALAAQRMGKDITDVEVREFMASKIEKVLDPVAAELELDLDHAPHVILVVGVNGSGKTTTIGKLGQKLYDAGYSTLLVAGDTFRAAAIEQLQIWGDRTQSPVVSRPLGSDAAGLAFDAYTQAISEGRDVMLMDTAGRLQNKTELMAELEKIIRVLKKQDPAAPHTVLLTLDATTGQNALNQVEIFKDVAGVNGLVMTKLDGTARGGIMVAIASKFKLPVYFIGVGEQVDDLEPFEARDFARSIAGLER